MGPPYEVKLIQDIGSSLEVPPQVDDSSILVWDFILDDTRRKRDDLVQNLVQLSQKIRGKGLTYLMAGYL